MERRKYTRITLNIPVILCLLQVEGYHAGTIANISEGGCFFPFDENLPVGEQCGITIAIGEGLKTEQFIFSGTIVRSDQHGVGIRFSNSDEAQKTAIAKIIEYYQSPSQVFLN